MSCSNPCSDTKTVFDLKVLDTLQVEHIVGKRILIEDNSPTTVIVSATPREGLIIAPDEAASAIAALAPVTTPTAVAALAPVAAITNLENIRAVVQENIASSEQANEIFNSQIPILNSNPVTPPTIPGITQLTTTSVATTQSKAIQGIFFGLLASTIAAATASVGVIAAPKADIVEADISTAEIGNANINTANIQNLMVNGRPITPPVMPVAQNLAFGTVSFNGSDTIVVSVPPNSGYIPMVTAITVDPALMIGISSGISVFNITPTSFTIARQIGDITTSGATYTIVGVPV